MIRQGMVVLAFILMALGAYLHFDGLPNSWKSAILQELAKQGIQLEVESMHLDPLRGVVARGVVYRTGSQGRLMVRIGELALKVPLLDVALRHFAVERVYVDGSNIQVTTGPGIPTIEIRHTEGAFVFEKGGVVSLQGVEGDLAGLRLEMKGRLDLSGKKKTETTEASAAAPPGFYTEKINHYLTKIGSVRTGKPVLIQMEIDGNVTDLRKMTVRASVRGRSIAYEKWRADVVMGEIVYAGGHCTVPAFTVEAGGGAVTVRGEWDANTRHGKFECSSRLNPAAMFEDATSGRASSAFANLKFGVAPEIWVKGEVDFSEGSELASSVKGECRLKMKDVEWRGTTVREIRGSGKIAEGRLIMPDFVIEQGEGRLEGMAGYVFKDRAIVFDVTSSLDMGMVMRMLYPGEKNWFYTAHYAKPPIMQLAGEWRIRDPNGLQAKGRLDWQDWSVHGVPVRGTKAAVEIEGRKFIFRDLLLTREEGKVSGKFALDFSNSLAELDVTSTVAFAELARLVGPKTEETFRAYHFPLPPKMVLKGTVDFGVGTRSDLSAHVEARKFSIWRLKASNVTADVYSRKRSLEIARYASDFYDGKLKGDAIFDLTTPEKDWAFHCKIERADFDRFTHDLWNYDRVQGWITGWAKMSGTMTSSNALKGTGRVSVVDGVLWKIPLFGELSKFIPILGEHKATKGTADFTVSNGEVNVEDVQVSAGIMSLTAKGIYKFDQTLDFIVQGHFLRGFFGIGYVFDPLTKAFEYHLGGKLNDRKWKPRFLPKELLLQFGDGETKPDSQATKEADAKNH